jgi:hypothetical protein
MSKLFLYWTPHWFIDVSMPFVVRQLDGTTPAPV